MEVLMANIVSGFSGIAKFSGFSLVLYVAMTKARA